MHVNLPEGVLSTVRGEFFTVVTELLDTVLAAERSALDAAEAAIATAVTAGNQVFAFGTGHSHCLALEFCGRAGGLVAPRVLLDGVLSMQEGLAKSTAAERLGGYGPMLVTLAEIGAGDVLIVISNSGRNAVPIQAAEEARRRGATTIAITSVAHSRASSVRSPATARLLDVADIVIDNHGCPGDAALGIDGIPAAMGATSTVIGAAIMQTLSIGVAIRMMAAGIAPEVYVSMNHRD